MHDPHDLSHLADHHRDSIAKLVRDFDLSPHPEGGYYRETWRSERVDADGRESGTAILFLLPAGVENRWHRVDAAEIWHHYAGGPLELSISEDGRVVRSILLGGDLAPGRTPQAIVPPHAWQAAKALDGYALCGCTVSPAFRFETFELAEPGWRPCG
jgi:predicted cupin superfamily sugar epimerase